jgi:hypothetical protein
MDESELKGRRERLLELAGQIMALRAMIGPLEDEVDKLLVLPDAVAEKVREDIAPVIAAYRAQHPDARKKTKRQQSALTTVVRVKKLFASHPDNQYDLGEVHRAMPAGVSRSASNQAVWRLAKEGAIVRVAQGAYRNAEH